MKRIFAFADKQKHIKTVPLFHQTVARKLLIISKYFSLGLDKNTNFVVSTNVSFLFHTTN